MTSSEKLCLQWNEFQNVVTTAFGDFRNDEDFTDVTLACEDGKQIEAHKVVLASTSPFFLELLKKNKHSHTLIYMKGIKSENMEAMVDFLYKGEGNLSQENVDGFLALAEEMRLKGQNSKEESNERAGVRVLSYSNWLIIFLPTNEKPSSFSLSTNDKPPYIQ